METRVRALSVILLPILSVSSALAKMTIHVPADQPTIQAAINVASDGDTVLVAPGTYTENINFAGKAITVRSSNGAKVTIIDGAQKNSVVTFNHSETKKSVLKGFTIQNGLAVAGEGGGIAVESSSPTIANNTITHNAACNGIGIAIDFGSPIVQKNKIIFNVVQTCTGGIGGGGISIGGAASAQILGNTISDNSIPNADGGGISLFAAGTPLIQGNLIRRNQTGGSGGGIVLFNQSDANIIDNVITNNTASNGGGIYWLTPSGTRGPFLVNDTRVANNSVSTQGSEIFADGFDINAVVINTIIVGKSGQTAFFCGNFNDVNPPAIQFNDVYNPSGTTYGGICTDPTGTNGNISADPKFMGKANFRLTAGSPAIDTGNNSAPDLPAKDFAGHPRIANGTVDLGAYEFVP
jgi:parallel beta-helix repeat protein